MVALRKTDCGVCKHWEEHVVGATIRVPRSVERCRNETVQIATTTQRRVVRGLLDICDQHCSQYQTKMGSNKVQNVKSSRFLWYQYYNIHFSETFLLSLLCVAVSALLLHCYHAVVTLLLHCCYTVITLLSLCCRYGNILG